MHALMFDTQYTVAPHHFCQGGSKSGPVIKGYSCEDMILRCLRQMINNQA